MEHRCLSACVRGWMPVRMRACVRAWMPVCMLACVRACELGCLCVYVRASVYVSVCVCRGGRPSWIFPRVRFAEAPVAYTDTVSAPSIRLFGGAYRFLS